MDLIIRRIKDAKSSEERLVLYANTDCNTSNYMVFDETFNNDGGKSDKLRHLFLFPPQLIKAGDFVWLYTHKKGSYDTHHNTSGTTTHKFYWGLEAPIWNKDGDKAYIVHYDDWASHVFSDKTKK